MRTLLSILLTACLILPIWAGEPGQAVTHDQALSTLRSGNVRYVSGQPHTWTISPDKRQELTKGQHPIACVITCSDSRVSPEILFDQSLGDVFVVRLAGNVISPEAVGSVEYAVAHLRVPLVVVLGHSSCGAVNAAITEPEMAGPIASLISYIKPSIDVAKQKGYSGDALAGAVISENARRGAESLLQGSRAIDEAVQNGSLSVLSAVYDLSSGRVAWQTQMSAPAAEAPMAAAPAVEKTVKTTKTTAPTTKAVVSSAKADPKHSEKVASDPKPAPRRAGHEVSSYAARH